MTDFVIVVAAVASLAASPNLPPQAAIPQNAPTVGFQLYGTLNACEDAVTHLTAQAGKRYVCLPVEGRDQELTSAY